MENKNSAPNPVGIPPTANHQTTTLRLTIIKTAFLYVLIGALVISAITAVLALLIGQFNASIGRSFLTIFILFAHSLFILGLLWADAKNQIGRNILPTTITGLAFANMITTTLATWDIISSESALRAFCLYILFLGTAFILAGTLKLRINQNTAQVSLYTAIGLLGLTIVSAIPWVLKVAESFDASYFRIIAALSILSTTAYMVAIILRGIALAKDPSLTNSSHLVKEGTPSGLMAYYVTLGAITAILWLTGFSYLAHDGLNAARTVRTNQETNYYRYN